MKQNRDTDMNLIFVDWEAGAAKLRRVFSQSVVQEKWDIAYESYIRLETTVRYWQSAVNARVVGAQVKVLVSNLINLDIIDISNFHLVGHSLGAHVMGYAGKDFNLENDFKLPRITGLDPAGPMFHYESMPEQDLRVVRILL